MGYKTPHHVREFLVGACLGICHDYKLRCQGRSIARKKELLEATKEIDLCARMAGYFGPTAHLAAQGAVGHEKVDLRVNGPTFRAEVKYIRPHRHFNEVRGDWDWLMDANNANEEFRRRAWVVFWPSAASDMFTFTNCLTVASSHGPQYSLLDYSPFIPYVETEYPPHGVNQRLKFKTPHRLSSIQLPGGRRARVDIVGFGTDPLWCAIYTRIANLNDIPMVNRYTATAVPIP